MTQSQRKPKRLPFIDKFTEYSTPNGYLYPVLSAFRAMLVEREFRWKWALQVIYGQPGTFIDYYRQAADISLKMFLSGVKKLFQAIL